MKNITLIITSIVVMAATLTAIPAFSFNRQADHLQPKKRAVANRDSLDRTQYTHGRHARMKKQLTQAQYHERQEERIKRAKQKVAREKRKKHVNSANGGSF